MWPNIHSRHVPKSSTYDHTLQLDGHSGRFLWGAQFGSEEDDQATGIVLGPVSSSSSSGGVYRAGDKEGSEVGRAGGVLENSYPSLYLTGWTRGALYSILPGAA